MVEKFQIIMEKDVLQPLADKIKVLRGDADEITLEGMNLAVQDANQGVAIQESTIIEIASLLQDKAFGSIFNKATITCPICRKPQLSAQALNGEIIANCGACNTTMPLFIKG